jgi:hypothetical protein
MLRLSWLAPLLLLCGCAYTPPKVTVYGATGKQYVAPDLCAAIVQCKLANESQCLYNATTLTLQSGDREVESCKQAK